MATVKTLQNLELHTEIVDPQTGRPNQYFLRLFQARAQDQLARVPGERKIGTLMGSGLEGGGDLTADRELSLTDTGVTPGTYVSATVTVDAQGRITSIVAGGTSYKVPFGFDTPTPAANEVMLLHTFVSTVIFADEWAGSYGNVSGNPAATYTFTVNKRTAAGVVTTVGTIDVSTAGVCTFATTGTTVTFDAGDQMQVIGAGTAGTITGGSFTFLGEEQ